MSGLNALKFIASKRQQGTSPAHARRQKLSAKLHEQIQMAKAVQSGTEFVPVSSLNFPALTSESRYLELSAKFSTCS
jgi:hypothetical protein